MYYKMEAKTSVGAEIVDYCRKNGKNVGELSLQLGLPYNRVRAIIYGTQKIVRPDTVERFASIGIDVSKEFKVVAKGDYQTFTVRLDRVGKDVYNQVARILNKPEVE